MSEEYQTALLQLQEAALESRTPFCPEDQQIAEYYDGGLRADEKVSLERHLSECRHCRARIGVIGRVEAGPADVRIPGVVLASARQMAGSRPIRRFRRVAAWAAAALVIMSLAAIVNNYPGKTGALPEPGKSSIDTREVRSVNRAASTIQVLSPSPGAEVLPGSTLEWAAVPDSLRYDVFVLSSVGDIILTERVHGTDWILDRADSLPAGGPYYFRVVAYLPDGQLIQSRHIAFTVQGE